MAIIRLTKQFHFEMAHVLEGYDGPCKNVHGHSYVLFQPTCENLIPYFANLIVKELPSDIKLHHLKLNETATSYAEWYASDNP